MQRFYGGPPDRWLHIPVALLGSYAQAMSRIDAEETLATIQAQALGSGMVPSSQSRAAMRSLQRRAGFRRERRQPSPDELAMIGIKVERK